MRGAPGQEQPKMAEPVKAVMPDVEAPKKECKSGLG